MTAPLRLVGPDFAPPPKRRGRAPKCCPLCLGPVYAQRPDHLLARLDAQLMDKTVDAWGKAWAAEYYAKQLMEHRAGLCDGLSCAKRAIAVFVTLLWGLRMAEVGHG